MIALIAGVAWFFICMYLGGKAADKWWSAGSQASRVVVATTVGAAGAAGGYVGTDYVVEQVVEDNEDSSSSGSGAHGFVYIYEAQGDHNTREWVIEPDYTAGINCDEFKEYVDGNNRWSTGTGISGYWELVTPSRVAATRGTVDGEVRILMSEGVVWDWAFYVDQAHKACPDVRFR